MTPKRAQFVHEYLVDKNATKAAQRSGYSEKTAYATAHNLMKDPEIKAAIDSGLKRQAEDAEKRAAKKGITKEKWLAELARIAFSDMDDFATIGDDGTLTLTPTAKRKKLRSRVIKKISQSKSQSVNSEGGSESLSQSIELWNKERALELIGKHFGWVKETVDGTHTHLLKQLEDLQQMSDDQLSGLAKEALKAIEGRK